MAKVLRRGVFETNSSMTHSLVIMTEENYKKLDSEDFYIYIGNPRWSYSHVDNAPEEGGVYTKEECIKYLNGIGYTYNEGEYDSEDEWLRDGDFETYDSWSSDEYSEICDDIYFTTPSGDKMVAMLKIGSDR